MNARADRPADDDTVTVPIPGHRSAEQALLVLDLLEELHRAVWDAYEEPLGPILRKQHEEERIIKQMAQAERSGQEAFDFDLDDDLDDPVPF